MLRTQNIKRAVEILQSGRIVAFPTGTAYGLAADASQGYALRRLQLLKNRPPEKKYTVFLREELYSAFVKLSEGEQRVLQHAAGHPLTLLVVPQPALSHLEQGKRVGIRSIDHPLMKALSEAVDVPLTATSANVADQPACYSPAAIEQAFSPRPTSSLPYGDFAPTFNTTYDLSLGCILDGGTLPTRAVSTIAQIINESSVEIVRPGAVTIEQIRSWLET